MIYNSRYTFYKTPFGAVSTREQVKIRFPLDAWISVSEVYFVLRKNDISTYYPMKWSENTSGSNIYEVFVECIEAGIYFYRFEMRNNDGVWYYGRDEFCNAVCGENLPEWQITVYNDDYKTPDFVKGGVIYHIFVDRFNKAGNIKTERKYRLHDNWFDEPIVVDRDGKYQADDFFGGNFLGIIDKLSYLYDLGVTTIYLSPIFKSFSNHRYDTGDYMQIDELIGSENDFKNLIDKAAEFGISIMLDGVFNHSGADSLYFNKNGNYNSVGAYQSKKSPYYDWYYFRAFPNDYDCWWGCTNVPNLNEANPKYRELLFGKNGVINKWTGLGVKGWRLDVVDELPIDFTDLLCETIKKADKNALIIGEVWEDASTKVSYGELRPYLIGGQLDGVMNYPFKNAIIDYVLNCNVSTFQNRIMSIMENYPRQSIDCLMNIIGTHDTVRIITALADVNLNDKSKLFKSKYYLDDSQRASAKDRLKLASLLQFTLPGVPSIYYGDEIGMEGFEDPINRRTFPWDKIDNDLLKHFEVLGALRRNNRNLFLSNFEIIDLNTMLAYHWTNGCDELIVLSNLTGSNQLLHLDNLYVNIFNGITVKGDIEIPNGFYGAFMRK